MRRAMEIALAGRWRKILGYASLNIFYASRASNSGSVRCLFELCNNLVQPFSEHLFDFPACCPIVQSNARFPLLRAPVGICNQLKTLG